MVVVRRTAAGKAAEDDATFLAVASRDALDGEGVGAVIFKDRFVSLPFPFPAEGSAVLRSGLLTMSVV